MAITTSSSTSVNPDRGVLGDGIGSPFVQGSCKCNIYASRGGGCGLVNPVAAGRFCKNAMKAGRKPLSAIDVASNATNPKSSQKCGRQSLRDAATR